ncbi:hypothetical protein G6F31_020574 [Rhizopus arrhizus]|nr:hypothetical protein G6F31_020574 [Rhizopus arrhizus]
MSVHQVWSTSIGSGSGLGFAPTVLGSAVYAATPDGSVGKFDLHSGRPLWKAKTDGKLSAGAGSDGIVLARFDASGLVVVKASDEELAEHETYLAALDKSVGGECVWRKVDAPVAAA